MDWIEPEYFTQEPIDLSTDQELEELERIQFLRNNSIEALESFQSRLENDGVVSKKLASSIRTVSMGLEGLDKHFELYPVLSYTEEPSRTNYTATLEGLLSGVSSAFTRAFDASFDVIGKINKEMDKVYRENDKKFDNIVSKLPGILKHLEKRPIENTDRIAPSIMILIKELSPMARWFIAPSVDDELTRIYGSPSVFLKKLAIVEATAMENAIRYIQDGIDRARDPNRFHELKALVGTKPEAIGFFNSNADVGNPKTFGDAFYGRAKTIRQDFAKPRKSDPIEFMDTRVVIASAVKWANMADFASVRLKDAKKYQTFHETVNGLREVVVPIVRSGVLKPGEPRLANDYLNDVRTLSKGILELELWLTEYRAAVLQVAKLLYVFAKSR